MLRFIVIPAWVALASSLVACAVSAPPSEFTQSTATEKELPQRGGVLHFPVKQAVPTLDPYKFSGNGNSHVYPRFEPLVILKRELGRDPRVDFDIQPWLGERWERPDDTTYVFHLRQGVKWDDGRDFSAEDGAFSINLLNDPKNGYGSARSYTAPIKKVEVVDRYTVRMELHRKNPDFLNTLTNVYMMPKHVIDEGGSFDNVSVGTGPFKMTAFDTRTGFAMTRNPNYWDAPRPYPDGLVGHYGLDDSGMLAGFVTQKLDLLTVERAQRGLVRGQVPNASIGQFLTDYGYVFYLRLDKPPFSDVRVRQAIHLALDRKEILSTMTGDEGIINPPGLNGQKDGYAIPQAELLKLPGFNPATRTQDIQQAKRLLTEAGYPAGFKTTIATSKDSAFRPQLAEMAAGQLRMNLGLDVTLQLQDAAIFAQRDKNGDFDMSIVGTAKMALNLSDRYHSKSPANSAAINDPELDRLIEATEATEATEQRKAGARAVQNLLLDKMYMIPTIETSFYPLSQPWVRNYMFFHGTPHAAPYFLNSDIWLDQQALPKARAGQTPRLGD